jgi:hypothetical protein
MRLFVFFLSLATTVLSTWGAAAQPKPSVVVWPTLTPAGDAPNGQSLHRPLPVADRDVYPRAQDLDATLRDGVQDLGFALYVADPGPAPGRMRDQDLLARATEGASSGDPQAGTWVVSPRIESAGAGSYIVRIVAVPPNGRELRVRVETTAAESLTVTGLVLLRDLLSSSTAAQANSERESERLGAGTAQGIASRPRSAGRALLAVNAGLFGAFSAYDLERSTGPNPDPRVLYPLLALGAGIGVGGALLVSDEWDVTTGSAWYVSSAAWWGAGSAFLIAAGRNVQPFDDRYSIGAGGGLIGATLATIALTRASVDEGGAMLENSGGAIGLLLGGALELFSRGLSPGQTTPYTGMGYGTAVGLLGAGALATRVSVSPSRVLLIDVGGGGGALVGAAAASPLIFQSATASRTRGWLASTIVGSLVGGTAAWWLTRDAPPERRSAWLVGAPSAGIIGESQTPRGSTPVYGIGWGGSL